MWKFGRNRTCDRLFFFGSRKVEFFFASRKVGFFFFCLPKCWNCLNNPIRMPPKIISATNSFRNQTAPCQANFPHPLPPPPHWMRGNGVPIFSFWKYVSHTNYLCLSFTSNKCNFFICKYANIPPLNVPILPLRSNFSLFPLFTFLRCASGLPLICQAWY